MDVLALVTSRRPPQACSSGAHDRDGRDAACVPSRLLSNLSNPKLAVFFTSLLPQFGGGCVRRAARARAGVLHDDVRVALRRTRRPWGASRDVLRRPGDSAGVLDAVAGGVFWSRWACARRPSGASMQLDARRERARGAVQASGAERSAVPRGERADRAARRGRAGVVAGRGRGVHVRVRGRGRLRRARPSAARGDEQVRAQDDRFVVRPGHETIELERAVEWTDEYVPSSTRSTRRSRSSQTTRAGRRRASCG